MKNLILAAVVLAFAMNGDAIAQTKNNQETACKLKVTGMTCAGCEAAVKLAAKRVDGVKAVTVSSKSGEDSQH